MDLDVKHNLAASHLKTKKNLHIHTHGFIDSISNGLLL